MVPLESPTPNNGPSAGSPKLLACSHQAARSEPRELVPQFFAFINWRHQFWAGKLQRKASPLLAGAGGLFLAPARRLAASLKNAPTGRIWRAMSLNTARRGVHMERPSRLTTHQKKQAIRVTILSPALIRASCSTRAWPASGGCPVRARGSRSTSVRSSGTGPGKGRA